MFLWSDRPPTYAVWVDDLDAPTCPNDGTVLREDGTGFVCRCGYRLPFDQVVKPPEFEGPDIDQRR